MTQSQINNLITNGGFPYPTEERTLIETHISWVILTDQYVYKIKKPLRFNFLDFSTLEKRKRYCEKEVQLNQRLAKDMYLDVLTVRKSDGKYHIGIGDGTIVDYAVLMKRMDEKSQMDLLLVEHRVTEKQIILLANKLAQFHKTAEIIQEGEEWHELYEEFADIRSVNKFVKSNFTQKSADTIEEAINWSKKFLESSKTRIDQRNKKGFVIDGHGDLHARNIILMEEPVIFDCIEFNDDFRKLDLLSEVAFLCMDLDRFGAHDFSKLFCEKYFKQIPCIENEIDQQLFLYYKMYRANVLVKVNCIRAMETDQYEDAFIKSRNKARSYLTLFKSYYEQLKRWTDTT